MFANNKMRENSGRLIKIYRERMHQGSKDKRFSCNEFILATREHPFYEVVEGEPVCSQATLNRLERGQIIKDDELYVFFIEKLGFKVDDFPGVMSQVELISAELFEAVELYDIRKIKEIDNKIETLFTKAKSYFYYSDIYEAFKIIIQYYLFAEYPNSVTAERMYYTSFLLSSKIDEILNSERKSEKRLNKIGIYNVNRRIKLTYGQEYAIRIDSKEGCFTKVTVRIPARVKS